MTSTSRQQTGPSWRALLGPVVLLAVMIGVGRVAGAHWPAIEDWVARSGGLGYAVYVAAWVGLSSLCFPVSVFGVSAGLLFGLGPGLALVVVSANAAALVMFGLGRSLLRRRIRGLIATRPRLAAIDRLAGEQALRLNLLTRLSPLNYGLACYTLAAGRTGLRDYLLGNLGSLPSMAIQVGIGAVIARSGRAAVADGGTARLALIAVGAAVLLVLAWQLGRIVRQALAEAEASATGSPDDPTA